jgi:hypothetical protein
MIPKNPRKGEPTVDPIANLHPISKAEAEKIAQRHGASLQIREVIDWLFERVYNAHIGEPWAHHSCESLAVELAAHDHPQLCREDPTVLVLQDRNDVMRSADARPFVPRGADRRAQSLRDVLAMAGECAIYQPRQRKRMVAALRATRDEATAQLRRIRAEETKERKKSAKSAVQSRRKR